MTKTILAALAILAAMPAAALASPESDAYLDRLVTEGNARVIARRAERAADAAAATAAIKARCAKTGGAAIGMTAKEVRASCWGNPKKTNETLTARGSFDQWVYGGGYIYLTDGVVTSIQTSK